MHIEPRYNPHELYHGTYLTVDGEYVPEGMWGWRIMGFFGWTPEYNKRDGLYCQWEQFTDWLWFRYPMGLVIEPRSPAAI